MATPIIHRNKAGAITRIAPVTREVETAGGKKLIITLGEFGITYREKGHRHTYGPIGYALSYLEAVARVANATAIIKPRPKKKGRRGSK